MLIPKWKQKIFKCTKIIAAQIIINRNHIMLIQQTINGLRELRLTGMIAALEIQLQQTDVQALAFEDRLGMLVDAEMSSRNNKKLERLLKDAKFKEQACIENINYDPQRKLNRSLIVTLATGNWVEAGQNLIITGATGAGKSWLACAFGNQLCRRG